MPINISNSNPSLAIKINNSLVLNIVVASNGLNGAGYNDFWINGVALGGTGRSHGLKVINSAGVLIFSRTYDVYGAGEVGGFTEANFRTDLDTYNTSGNIILINTFDEPARNAESLANKLRDNPYNFKTSRLMLGATRTAWCGIYRNGWGVLAESAGAYWNSNGAGVTVIGDQGRAFCTCQATVVLN
jgi:hypothetical protein